MSSFPEMQSRDRKPIVSKLQTAKLELTNRALTQNQRVSSCAYMFRSCASCARTRLIRLYPPCADCAQNAQHAWRPPLRGDIVPQRWMLVSEEGDLSRPGSSRRTSAEIFGLRKERRTAIGEARIILRTTTRSEQRARKLLVPNRNLRSGR